MKAVIVLLTILFATGCVFGNKSYTNVSNKRIFNNENYTNIEINKTTKNEVMLTFGIADKKDKGENDKEYWEYRGVNEVKTRKGVLFLYSSSNVNKEKKKVTFVFENDTLVELIK